MVLMGHQTRKRGRLTTHRCHDALSFLIYGTTKAEVKGLDQIPHDQWPTALPLLYYAYHIMAGLGTWFLLLMVVAGFCCGVKSFTRLAWCYGLCCSAFHFPISPIPLAG